jgi:glycosidase
MKNGAKGMQRLKNSEATPNSLTEHPSYPNLEFHLRDALSKVHDFRLPLFALENGKFKIAYRELQALVQALNESEASPNFSSSELHGLGLMSLLFHKVIRLYRNQINPGYISDLSGFLEEKLDTPNYKKMLAGFLTALPSESSKSSTKGIKTYLEQKSSSVPNEHIVVEELLIHLLALQNPAFDKYGIVFKEVFHDELKHPKQLLESIEEWSNSLSGFGPDKQNIIELILAPMRAAPNSIRDQLAWIQANWENYLGSHLLDLLRGLDHFEEEERYRGAGPGETLVPKYTGDLLEGEFYSEDSAWMPNVVMIARNSLVWLDQLSKKYKQEITTLDAIPDQELDLLAEQGFTVLWLIGLWNRSSVSKKIKHWCGNPDAESSAYSLKDYTIDPSIGGAQALDSLRRRAWERGIRLASDMVPNHTGLDADWLKHHPEWYITTDHAPFPSYRFEGGDLSEDSEVSIQLEDHYYERSDASVVFKHYDHRNGQTRFVYHGNDGTSMPWNDTAQLNYLNPELREAVIQTILEVARQFKVIRFDAAMTLAKRHIQRLWFPEPGSGGDIPSRSEYNMSGSDFNAAIPAEFWREVVDRVAKEVPDTLLLAEAFWMMEGYFVRTLGMHRVYNSAFMNMLKMEENSKFFEMIAGTLEFDPRILQRFVNFLSNPDEDTAIAQFGKGDKYFGATILMITLPGLPMFAHAQIEGYEEKYGMEYRRAYWDETPDEALVQRHKVGIFPLMKKRHLFAGSSNFRLFPMHNANGDRIDSVFAYTNRLQDERSLVLVNNSYNSQLGWIKTAVPFNTDPTAGQTNLSTDNILSALAFDSGESQFLIFQEQITQNWFIRNVDQMSHEGLYFEISGYKSQIFLNFQMVSESNGYPWSEIARRLNGESIKDFDHIHRLIELEPIHQLFMKFMQFLTESDELTREKNLFVEFSPLFEAMMEMNSVTLGLEELRKHAETFSVQQLDIVRSITELPISDDKENTLLSTLLALSSQIEIASGNSERGFIESFMFKTSIQDIVGSERGVELSDLMSILDYASQTRSHISTDIKSFFELLFTQAVASKFLLINESEGASWYNKERMEIFLDFFNALFVEELADIDDDLLSLALESSEYQLSKFVDALA